MEVRLTLFKSVVVFKLGTSAQSDATDCSTSWGSPSSSLRSEKPFLSRSFPQGFPVSQFPYFDIAIEDSR